MSDAEHAQFEQLYRAHRASILAYLTRRTTDASTAADLVADVFLIAWQRRDALPPVGEQRLWLFGVARNTLLSHHRRRSRDIRLTQQLAQAITSARSEVATVPADDRVAQALESLSTRDRELLTLAVWDGLTTDEIATVVGLRPTAARVALHRARLRFREALIAAGVQHCAAQR